MCIRDSLNSTSIVLSDSGGIQEEACIAGVHCLTLRDNTKRPESVDVGANTIVGVEKAVVIDTLQKKLVEPADWKNPYGDGLTSEKIIDDLIFEVKGSVQFGARVMAIMLDFNCLS